ncbi:MotE family protein [Desulfovibrio oxyclinae]|uniref:MotE family protein n=1 Tax=Desulfovibrio oxyclinae TaxID=63560 RepID=UPI001FE14095|nr:magnesium transporter MgtE [Desulfovibrio oxyclinae]
MKKKVAENKKKTKKCQRFGSNLRISKILLSLIFLALIKLAVFGVMGVDSLTARVTEAVIPSPAPTEAMAAEDEGNGDQEQPAAEDGQSEASSEKPADMSVTDWKTLKRKEEELANRERELRELEAGIKAQMAELKELRQQIGDMLDEAKNLKNKKVRQLVDMISNTKAKKAAKILENMEEDLAVKVLSGMRGRQAGEILSYVETEKAATLSERLTNLQIPFEDN